MSLNYKNLMIALAAGGGVMLAVTLYDHYLRRRPHHLRGKDLSEDFKAIGPIVLTKEGLVEKRQMGYINGLAKRYARTYAKGDRKRLARTRLVHISTGNYKAYMDVMIDTLNFEYQCMQDICEELRKELNIAEETFSDSQDYYNKMKDAEYAALINAVAQKVIEVPIKAVKEASTVEAMQLKEDLERFVLEAKADTTLTLSNDAKIKLRDADMFRLQTEITEIRAYDLMREKHGMCEDEIKEILRKHNLLSETMQQVPADV